MICQYIPAIRNLAVGCIVISIDVNVFSYKQQGMEFLYVLAQVNCGRYKV